MGRLTLPSLFKSKLQRRIDAEHFDPRKAPHRALISDLLRAHLPALQLRLRSDLIEELALRILVLEPTPVPFCEEPEPTQLFTLVSRVQQAIRQLEVDCDFLARRFDNLSTLIQETDDEEQAHLIMVEYLTQTVSNPKKLRDDIKALKRYMDLDAVREREDHERQRLTVCIELGTLFIAGALDAALRHEDEDHRPPAETFCDVSETDQFLSDLLARDERWQTRLAAVDGLHRLCGHLAEAGVSLNERMDLLNLMTESVTTRDEHPWVRAKALETVLIIHPQRGESLLIESLRSDDTGMPGQMSREFLLRRLIVDQLVDLLPVGRAAAILDALIGYANPAEHTEVDTRLDAVGISRPEPSEHVRMGIAIAVAELPPSEAIARLRRLAGLEGSEEASLRVRTQAIISARKLASAAADLAVREAASELILDSLAVETETLPLQCACDELAGLAADLAADAAAADAAAVEGAGDAAASQAAEDLQTLAPAWIDALVKISRNTKYSLASAEFAAAAAERIARELSSERRQATRFLLELARGIPPGKSRSVALSKLPAPVAEQCRDERTIGRILADLARGDWGLVLAVAKHKLTLWRGDQWRRRLWRVVHELRHPAPNKRQSFLHTIGRSYQGRIRAHPGRLDEQTATTVPGERVYVDAEGSWGRHLPTVDDLLDLPFWRSRPVYICSSYGITTLVPPRSWFARLYSRLAITWRYPSLVALRQSSISAEEPQQRQIYLKSIRDRFGIDISFMPYDFAQLGASVDVPTHPAVAALFPKVAATPAKALTAATAALLGPLDSVAGSFREWFEANLPYFRSATQNSQTALAIYMGALVIFYVTNAYVKRRGLERARNALPLSIGGWGTRGKSGTERLKAGLFSGLGFDIFVKTTGCEAMLMHAAPGQKPIEIFVYRPYDKATIWEQYNLVTLAANLDPDVYMWECMALNPRYVMLLQHEWMRDDIITLTNAYPDHEDIQGPAGINVAEVIGQFIGYNTTLITSEVNFLSMFAEVCRERDTRLLPVSDRDADLIADDVLDLYPYREHPRNIALVAKMGEELGLDPMLSIVTMAEHVVADLGVLKAYPTVRVRGRTITFMNGMSANERTGCLTCWRRMGLDRLDPDTSPDQAVMTVVNNRADRISRSEVFSRIIVRDLSVDRHVLIGTNLKGLRYFLGVALDTYLAETYILDQDDLEAEAKAPQQPRKRLAAQMGRLRIPTPKAELARGRLEVYARAASLAVDESRIPELDKLLAQLLEPKRDAPLSYDKVHHELQSNGSLMSMLESALTQSPPPAPPEEDILQVFASIETIEPAVRADVVEHFLYQLTRMVIRGRLEAYLDRALEAPTQENAAAFRESFLAVFRDLFEKQLVLVENPETKGDQIVNICARSVPPGTHINLMGVQNIKGTGLDFVYRWIAVDTVVNCLLALQSDRGNRRIAALRELEGFADNGVVDAGLARQVLANQPVRQPSPEETVLRDRIRNKLDNIYNTRVAKMSAQTKKDNLDRFARVFEGMVDYLDSIRRHNQTKQVMNDLVEKRISHGRAAIEMRQLVARQKGGWLAKGLRKWMKGSKGD